MIPQLLPDIIKSVVIIENKANDKTNKAKLMYLIIIMIVGCGEEPKPPTGLIKRGLIPAGQVA